MVATGQSTLLRRAGSFFALLAFEVGAVVLLSRLGRVPQLQIPWHSLTPWLWNSPVEDVLAAVLRMIALLIAWWLLATNLLYLAASLTRVPGAIRAVRWCTLPLVRRATDHALALTLATSLVGVGTSAAVAGAAPMMAAAPQRSGPVGATEAPPRAEAAAAGYMPTPAGPPREDAAAGAGQPGYVPRPAGHPPVAQPAPSSSSSTTSTTGFVPRPAGPPSSRSTTPTTPTTPTTEPPGSTTTTTTPPTTTSPPGGGGGQGQPPAPPSERQRSGSHQVVPGDNLWTISRNRLALVTNRSSGDISDHEIASYWLRVIAVNRSSLRSGNPDLIFPGEIIHLPPVGRS